MSEPIKKKKSDIVISRETKFCEYITPDYLKTWEDGDTYSKEYVEMLDDISSICDHICKLLNEGPETKDSFTKRALTLRAIFRFLLQRTFLNNFSRLGLLEQIRFDLLYSQEMVIAMKKYQKAMMEEAKKEKGYAT